MQDCDSFSATSRLNLILTKSSLSLQGVDLPSRCSSRLLSVCDERVEYDSEWVKCLATKVPQVALRCASLYGRDCTRRDPKRERERERERISWRDGDNGEGSTRPL